MAAGLYDITNEILGKGHYAIVKIAKHCLTGEHVAIKIVDKLKLTKEGLEQLSCEIKLWSILSRHEHPNVVKLYQCIDTRTKLYLVMEYCGTDVCDLYDHIQKKNDGNGLDESEAKHIFRQICNAIFYCHSLKIVHRDLKPENVLIINNQEKCDEITVKLIDFGFSNQWCEDELLSTSCGSLAYSAPEILLGDQYDGPKVDIWALGCILYILLYGHNPFMQFNDNETLIKILDCSFTTPDKPSINEMSIDLIRNLLKKDPNMRLSIEEIINHPWLRDKSCKLSNEFEKKEPKHKNLVHEHIIDQMIDQGISVSKDVIKKILKNEQIETMEPKESENDIFESNVNDHHYIKATYHLLKDKSIREFKGIYPNQQTSTSKLRQNKRGIITKKKDLIRCDSNNSNTGKRSATFSSTQSTQSTQSLSNLDVTHNSSPFVLPLARKCSIVSEEGSIYADNNINNNNNNVQEILNIQERISNSSTNTTQHSIDIFVTDTSSKLGSRINRTSSIEHFYSNQNNNNDVQSPRKEPGLHPVSSSPDFLKTESIDVRTSKVCDLNDGFIRDNGSFDVSEYNKKAVFDCYTKKNDKKMNNVRIINASKPTLQKIDGPSRNKSPSVRVIIQSKSLNNISFAEHHSESTNNKLTNSISSVSIKPNKTEKNDCCSIN